MRQKKSTSDNTAHKQKTQYLNIHAHPHALSILTHSNTQDFCAVRRPTPLFLSSLDRPTSSSATSSFSFFLSFYVFLPNFLDRSVIPNAAEPDMYV